MPQTAGELSDGQALATARLIEAQRIAELEYELKLGKAAYFDLNNELQQCLDCCKRVGKIEHQLAESQAEVERLKDADNTGGNEMKVSMNDLRELLLEDTSDTAPAGNRHPYYNRRVLAIMPHGFIHFGLLRQQGDYLILKDASNLRYWSKRDGGLPEFAQKGPGSEDKIDKIGEVVLETPMFFYLLGDWDE